MKHILLWLAAAAAAAGIITGCTRASAKDTTDAEGPMFWTWLDYREGMNFDSVCALMDSAGLDGIMLNAPTPDHYRRLIPTAQAHGITVYAWLWTLNLEHDSARIVREHPDWLCVNRNGHSLVDSIAYVRHYNFMCPGLPEVHDYLRDRVRSFAEVEGLEGIAIDYQRMVDVVLPTTIWPRYGIVQEREMPQYDYGYHPAMIERFKAEHGYDPREQADPSQDTLWRQWRTDRVSELARELAAEVHACGKVMAASPFPTPKMATRMVRQNWKDWDLDEVFPMVYHNFYTRDPSFIADCTLENERELRGSDTRLFCGMMASDSTTLFECMDSAFANGARGIALFTMQGLRTPSLRGRMKAYADSMRQVRAEGRLAPRPGRPDHADTDPFSHAGVMARVEKAMQQAITGDKDGSVALKLGDYEPVEKFDATTRYTVLDSLSGRRFTVSFYTYGDVLSGWRVE